MAVPRSAVFFISLVSMAADSAVTAASGSVAQLATIFNDGFVAGNACSWSTMVPLDPPLISEIAVQPSGAEFVEIYNPGPPALDLERYYLADFRTYYELTIGNPVPVLDDFRVHFPTGASLACGDIAVVSLETASTFFLAYGSFPDFHLAPTDANALGMVGQYAPESGLSNASEMVVLFRWDGIAELVGDADYLYYGTSTANAMDKSGVVVVTLAYLPETPPASQLPAPAPAVSMSLGRCDPGESTETASGSNGITGHDETSEDFAYAFRVGAPTPGIGPVLGPCP